MQVDNFEAGVFEFAALRIFRLCINAACRIDQLVFDIDGTASLLLT